MAKSIANPAVAAELGTRIKRIRPESPRAWGTMTPAEMLCHLADSAASVLGGSKRGPFSSRPMLKWLALYSPLPWQRGTRTSPEVDAQRPGNAVDFDRDRARALEALAALVSAPAGAFPTGHRVFGQMNHKDWQHWAYKHMNHHLRQFGA